MLKLPDFGLGWKVAVGAGVAALALLLWQNHRVEKLETKVAQAEADKQRLIAEVAREQAQRAALALDYKSQLAAADLKFTTTQQEKDDAFNKQRAALEDRRRADGVQLARLRDTIAIYATAAGSPEPYSSASAAAVSSSDRLAVLGGLLSEGAGLVVEGRALVEQREGELKRVLDELHATRARCDAGAASTPGK